MVNAKWYWVRVAIHKGTLFGSPSKMADFSKYRIMKLCSYSTASGGEFSAWISVSAPTNVLCYDIHFNLRYCALRLGFRHRAYSWGYESNLTIWWISLTCLYLLLSWLPISKYLPLCLFLCNLLAFLSCPSGLYCTLSLPDPPPSLVRSFNLHKM